MEYSPFSVNVEILDATPDMYLQADSLVQGKYVVQRKCTANHVMNQKEAMNCLADWGNQCKPSNIDGFPMI